MNPRPCQIAASFLLGIAIFPGVSAQTPSFECAKASTLRERTVCASPRLSEQDTQIAAAYKAELASLTPASAALVRSDQREWLQWLDRICSSKSAYNDNISNCLQNQYSSRLSQLRQHPPGQADPTFYNRASFVLVQSKEAAEEHPSDNDPGFGTGEFIWPQIDKPTPAQARWNRAILAAAIKTTADKETNKAPTSFATAADASGTVTVQVSVLAANNRLIVADVVNSTYGYGAAHPNTFDTYFAWWMEPGRELTVADVFKLGADEAEDRRVKLIPLFFEKLKPGLEDENQFWDAPKIRESIAAELANPRAWTINREGLTLHFGQYEIGPYSIGMPSVTLTWRDLEPYLASTLHPESLPSQSPALDR